MQVDRNLIESLNRLIGNADGGRSEKEGYGECCRCLGISRMYFDRNPGEEYDLGSRFANVIAKDEMSAGERTIVYDEGERTEYRLHFPYFRNGENYINAFLEFKRGIKEEDVDKEQARFFSDLMYVLVSRRNMRKLIDYSENSDALTGIPNVVFLAKKYREVTKTVPPHELLLLRMNLQNFRNVNDAAGAKAGDEAITQYARKICDFVNVEDEGVCRLGGDNFVLFIRKENADQVLKNLQSVFISNLKAAPGRTFNISPWIGISELKEGRETTFAERLGDASAACELAKAKLRKSVVYFDAELEDTVKMGRNVMSMFRPAMQKHEFHAYFQPKIDMRTGELVGFEALCRWIHEGRPIYPDKFIPVLDINSMIQDLDMAIFAETCSAVRQWHNMGLKPPRVSSNFSRKNLFVDGIEEKIIETIDEFGLVPDDMEIEITESVRENEYERLMNFVQTLKSKGMHISVDDFGTGYSSLSLIHNIDVDAIKIDRSFVSMLPGDTRSKVLVESILNIAKRLGLSVIAEGVETAEQGRSLMEMGCNIAQGYYYSKPVDFDEATRIIENPSFRPMGN